LGLVGFSNALALEGGKYNIHSNAIAPTAGSRLTKTVMPTEIVDALKPDYVAPLVLLLCHESSKENGGLFEVGGGFAAKLRWQRTKGSTLPLNQPLTPEILRKNWSDIVDWTNATNPSSSQEANMNIMANLATANQPAASTDSSSSSSSLPLGHLKSAPFFDEMARGIKDHPELVKQISAVFKWKITSGDKTTAVVVDLKTPGGKISVVPADDQSKADVTLTLSDEDFVGIASGKLNPQQLFFQKKLQIQGNIMLSQKLSVLFNSQRAKAKL